MSTILRVPLRDGAFKLPAEAMRAIGSVDELYLEINADRQTVLLSVRHPDVVHNECILDQIAGLQGALSPEEYGEPVPNSFLSRRGKGATHEGEK